MIKFLINRPISVFMAITALIILGVIAYFNIPVSLLPNIDIPKITVQVTGNNVSARELENTVVTPLRQHLMQVGHLRDIRSETRDEIGVIYLSFDYGTRTNLSFIEVNEKIDGVMNSLPREINRPQVIKANATDLPIFNLNLTLKDAQPFGVTDEHSFLQLCEISQNIIKRRLEQLPEVAMVDVTGILHKQLIIVPDLERMHALNIDMASLEAAIAANNVETGGTVVRDGQYEYSIKFSSILRTPEDVENIYLKIGTLIIQLKDIAKVVLLPEKEKGASYYNGKRAVTLSIVKQANGKIADLDRATNDAIQLLGQQYPEIEFTVTQNQSKLLDVTIGSLQQDLVMGLILICCVALFFMRNVKMPIIIALVMIVSLIISILALYLFRISLNIVSIAGLILSLGIMIDNGIIVADNITQFREKGFDLDDACIKGTNEVITPMLSSTFTNIAVFLPLIFMSGIAGAIFYDQAVSITLSLLVSYLIGIIFLPVLYKIAFSPQYPWAKQPNKTTKKKNDGLIAAYEKGVGFTFAHKKSMYFLIILSIPLCVHLFNVIPKSKMPYMEYDEMVLNIDWNEQINTKENSKRVNELINTIKTKQEVVEAAALVGLQQFLIDRGETRSSSQTKLSLKSKTKEGIQHLEKASRLFFRENYPKAIVKYEPPETVFEAIFATSTPDIIIELYPKDGQQSIDGDSLTRFQNKLSKDIHQEIGGLSFSEQLLLFIDREKLLMYDISYDELLRKLRTSFSENKFAVLRSYSQYLPIVMASGNLSIENTLSQSLIQSSNGQYYPIGQFIRTVQSAAAKEIIAGKNGEFIPFVIEKVKNDQKIENTLTTSLNKYPEWDYSYSGAFFQTKDMLNQLVIVLLISILLMYFILAAQFESFLQPLILFIELPIDIVASLLLLLALGHTLNLMSAIGIIVTCGIIINDSILKIDVINDLRKQGVPLMDAIHEAGKKRLRAILMTALTSILAFFPLLFSSDMGSELQKPLAIGMIAAMIVGTLVSLFVIPLIYWLIYRGKIYLIPK